MNYLASVFTAGETKEEDEVLEVYDLLKQLNRELLADKLISMGMYTATNVQLNKTPPVFCVGMLNMIFSWSDQIVIRSMKDNTWAYLKSGVHTALDGVISMRTIDSFFDDMTELIKKNNMFQQKYADLLVKLVEKTHKAVQMLLEKQNRTNTNYDVKTTEERLEELKQFLQKQNIQLSIPPKSDDRIQYRPPRRSIQDSRLCIEEQSDEYWPASATATDTTPKDPSPLRKTIGKYGCFYSEECDDEEQQGDSSANEDSLSDDHDQEDGTTTTNRRALDG